MRRSILHVFLGLTCLVSIVPAAHAAVSMDTYRLERYYTEYLKSVRNQAYYEPLIDEERKRVRGLLQEEINTMVSPAETEKGTDLESSKAIDRQRQIVEDVGSRLNESTVDLNLLRDEEKIYKQEKTAGTGAFMITKSYPELLARKVVLEEETDLLTTTLTAQQKRLTNLLSEQRTASFGTLFTIFWYLALIVVIIWVETLVRTQLIYRIPQRRIRYSLGKIFTTAIYLSLLFWLVQRLFLENPGFTTVLAVIGAALVFMLQDVIKSFLGWLTYKGALTLGQRVHVGGYTGDVLDIGVLFTTILVSRSPTMPDATQAGKIVRIPNAQLLTGNLLNFHSTSDFESAEIPVRIAEPRQWERTKQILEEILVEEAERFTVQARAQMDRRMRGFFFSQVSPASRVYMEFTDKGQLTFLLCFPVPIGHRRAIITQILERILARFEQESILIADPE